MAYQFLVRRKDNERPIQGARIRLELGYQEGITDKDGRARVDAAYKKSQRYTVSSPLFKDATGEVLAATEVLVIHVVELEPLPAPSPPQPQPAGDVFQSKYGKSCTFYKNDTGITTMFVLVDDKTGERSPYNDNRAALYQGYAARFRCDDPMPPTIPEWQKGISESLSKFYGETKSALDGLAAGIAKIGKDLLDLEARIKAWVEDQILEIIWRAMQRDKGD